MQKVLSSAPAACLLLLLTSCAASGARAPESPRAAEAANWSWGEAAAAEPIGASASSASTQDGSDPSAHAGVRTPTGAAALKQANNPIAKLTAVTLENYYIPEVSGSNDTANTFWARIAKPVRFGQGDWLVRASLPLTTLPVGGNRNESGVGDSNLFAAYLFESEDPGVSLGFGPLLGIPTATQDAVGTDQWSAGLAGVYFDARSSLFQYGGLMTYQHKFAGEDRAPDVNRLVLQPLAFMQLGNGNYLRSAGIWAFDLETGNYNVPLGMGLGKIFEHDGRVFNFYVEPTFTVLQDGFGQPEFQILFGFKSQFIGS